MTNETTPTEQKGKLLSPTGVDFQLLPREMREAVDRLKRAKPRQRP